MAVNSFRTDEQLKQTDKKKIAIRLLHYLKDYKLRVVAVLVCMGVAVAIELLNPMIIEVVIDKYIAKKNMNGLIRMSLFALGINLVYLIAIKIRIYFMNYISNNVLRKIRKEVYVHIQELSVTFFDKIPTGKVLTRIIGDVNALKEVFSNAVMTLIPSLAKVIGVLIVMLLKDWKLTLASLCAIPLVGLIVMYIQKKAGESWQAYRKKSSNMSAYVHEVLSGIRVVKSFSANKETYRIFKEITEEERDSYIKASVYSASFGPATEFSGMIGIIMIYMVGVWYIGTPKITVGLLVAFTTYFTMFWSPIASLSSLLNQIISNLSAAERVFDILDTDVDIFDVEDAVELSDMKGKVEFENVSFGYDTGGEQENLIFKDMNFTVSPGENIAIVGPTGSGKTTIVNLILRFYDVTSGRILVDGQDVRKIKLRSLRRQIGLMSQESFIFSGTIRENILYGNPNATEKEMIEAAKAVGVHEFIKNLKNGYDTELKERGEELSLGERQLIALARTMLIKPKIIILDEATSKIDTHTEKVVQKGTKKLLAGKTSFVIAHRLSTIQNADRIFVIDQGRIVEEGTAKELMEKKGLYYELYMTQFRSNSESDFC